MFVVGANLVFGQKGETNINILNCTVQGRTQGSTLRKCYKKTAAIPNLMLRNFKVSELVQSSTIEPKRLACLICPE